MLTALNLVHKQHLSSSKLTMKDLIGHYSTDHKLSKVLNIDNIGHLVVFHSVKMAHGQ